MGLGNVSKYLVSRYFWLIREDEIENLQDYYTLKGSSEMYSCRCSNAISLAIYTRQLTCFCSMCMYFVWDECESRQWVEN